MHQRKSLHKIITKKYPDSYALVLQETEQRYLKIAEQVKFASTSKNPLDKRMDVTAYLLAFIQTLEQHGHSFDEIKTVCLEVAYEHVRPKNKLQHWLKRLPVKLGNKWLTNILLQKLNKKVRKRGHPDGFVAEILTNKEETYGLGYGVDILECGICKLFQKHNAQTYTPILCEIDHITSSLAGLTLIRTGTIALGAAKCDFRFQKQTES